jgi:hypothetical protein
MKTIEGTNLQIKEGYYIVFMEGSSERILVIANNTKVIKKYVKAGYKIFCNPTFFSNDHFWKLNKRFNYATRKGIKISILNEMWHIQNHSNNNNTIHLEIN